MKTIKANWRMVFLAIGLAGKLVVAYSLTCIIIIIFVRLYCYSPAGTLLCLHWILVHQQQINHQHPSTNPSESTTYAETDEMKLNKLSTEYCHQSLLKSVTGLEGMLPSNADQYELVQVHMLLRHGDRSQATDFRVNPPVRYECGMVDGDSEWKKLQDFTLVPHPSHAKLKQINTILYRGDQPKACRSGQLTLIGFQQHRKLGYFMQDRYNALIRSVTNNNDVFIQSTNFQRTIHSAAAFLLGFNSKRMEQPGQSHLPIHVSKDINFSLPPNRLSNNYPKCKKLDAVWKKELAKQSQDGAEIQTFHRLKKMLDVKFDYSRTALTTLYDLLWCRMCHNLPRPCGSQVCPTTKQLLDGALESAKSFTIYYPTKLSKVKTQAYIANTVIGSMEHAVNTPHRDSYIKITASFAHDSVLTPLLHSLGANHSAWPPYASRLVIEFWRAKNKPVDDDNSYFVRLLYNGKPLGLSPAVFTAGSELIEYPAWKESLLTGSVRSMNEYRTICGVS